MMDVLARMPDWDVIHLGCWGTFFAPLLTPSELAASASTPRGAAIASRMADMPEPLDPAVAHPAVLQQPSSDDPRVVRTHQVPVGASCRPNTTSCWVCGGTHAMVYRHDRLRHLIDSLSYSPSSNNTQAPGIDFDCTISMPPDPTIKSFCVQIPGVRPSPDFSSTRAPNAQPEQRVQRMLAV